MLFSTNPGLAGPGEDLKKVKSFISDLADDRVDYDTIIQKHLCIGNKVLSPPEQEEKDAALKAMLEALREQLQKNPAPGINKYSKVPRKYQTLQIEEEEESNVYALQVKGKDEPPGLILVKDGRIASFTAISKSGMRSFLLICSDL